MKEYEFLYDIHQAKHFFFPIRTKRDVIKVLMQALKLIATYRQPPVEIAAGRIIIRISKMSRIFFTSEKKIYSLIFPFSVSENNGQFRFHTDSHPDIGHRTTSQIISLINTTNFFSQSDAITSLEAIFEECAEDVYFWPLFRDLMLLESGYIRFDNDAKNARGHKHPLNHLDIFYSQNTTFKVGLLQESNIEHFCDMLDITTNCHYLQLAN